MRLARNILRLVLIVAAFCAAYPPLVNVPFVPQHPGMLQLALWIARHLLVIETVCAAIAVAVWFAVFIRADRRTPTQRYLFLTLGVLFCAVISRADIYETIFHPLGVPSFAPALETKLDSREKVMVISVNGSVRAYPIRQVSYHHVVNDVVAGVPVAATYCGLCHTGLVWAREVDGKVLTLHIAGINNQNFLMRDDETGSYWQQVSGQAIAGPMKGKSLRLIHSDELSFGLFRSERPLGLVLKGRPADEKFYEPEQWNKVLSKIPVVKTHPGEGFDSRDLMLSVKSAETVKAYPYKDVVAEKLVRDRMGEQPIVLVVGPDGESVRAFRVPPSDFYRTDEASGALMMDSATGSKWNFQGCAVEGASQGQCLEALDLSPDYWFNWRSYHPDSAVYRKPTGSRVTAAP